ncbi:MAG: putative phage-related protein [bacterium]|nr:putative phage-related protein [bacterium]
MITDAQREARKNGIFSSDVPRIMAGDGVRVALEKLGELERENLDDVIEIQIGNLVEPRILDAYEAQHGRLVVRSPDTLRHPVHTWLGAHLDGIGDSLAVEAKTVGWYMRREWGAPGSDEVPDRVLWQVQEQLAVTRMPLAHVPVCFIDEKSLKELLTGKLPPIEIYVIPADRDLEAYIVERCGKVWRHVEARTLPDPETPTDARILYRKDTGLAVEADDTLAEEYKRLVKARAHKAAAEALEDEAKARLQAFMKDASELRYCGKTLCTWKKEKDRDAYTVSARPGSRKFLIKEVAI